MKAVKYLRPGIALVDVEEPQLEKADDAKLKSSMHQFVSLMSIRTI